MSTQAEAYEYRIRQLEKELANMRKHVLRLSRDLRDERAINRNLAKDVAKLGTIKKVLSV